MLFTCATSDPHATARARALALDTSDLAVEDRHPVMRFLVQQWGVCRNELAEAPTPSSVASSSSGGGHGGPSRHHDTRRDTRATDGVWTTVPHGKQRSHSSQTAPSTASASPAPLPAPTQSVATATVTRTTARARQPRHDPPPSYTDPIEDWVEYIRANPDRCPRGVPMHPENSILRGGPVRRVLERHIELRRNGPEGREQVHRASRGHWVTRTTQLLSIRGLLERVMHKHHIQPVGNIPQSRPYTGDTRNLSFENVARHLANNGYHPRSPITL
ncbi:hypothetical protein FA95DRAFT_1607676 [Auriscalpium vulgare]|uniref:Uncharacterized protein n=1 Tax=Auriscalpium vulgare TaxID=40419 RepID=A0ACB8RMU7_9AGAM|nr:hypothetical protein FA95DRAFT_1607676 [Auriscalpium vulgare]